ncbi:hypothetical protein V6N13_000941 [Hibiscus sabdariffa]
MVSPLLFSRPCLSASKEDMSDLLTRINIGDVKMKRQDLCNLYQAMVDDERHVNIVVEIGETMVKKMKKHDEEGWRGGTEMGMF